jgi:hypothetical protein
LPPTEASSNAILPITRAALSVVLIGWLLCAGLLAARSAIGAEPAPATKQEFLKQQAIYLSIEITEAQSHEFGTVAKDSLTDSAGRVSTTARFEIPLEMPLPDACPSTTSSTEAMEQGHCIGWTIATPDFDAVETALTTGEMDMAGNPMYSPVEFSVDSVSQSRFRDSPATGFATETTTSKGRGTAYLMRSGMLMCDLKKMNCDLNNVFTPFQDGTDLVTVTGVSDIQRFEAFKETVGPSQHLPKVPQDLQKKMIAFPITLPQPITKVFSEGTVSVKVTLSSKSATKPVTR